METTSLGTIIMTFRKSLKVAFDLLCVHLSAAKPKYLINQWLVCNEACRKVTICLQELTLILKMATAANSILANTTMALTQLILQLLS